MFPRSTCPNLLPLNKTDNINRYRILRMNIQFWMLDVRSVVGNPSSPLGPLPPSPLASYPLQRSLSSTTPPRGFPAISQPLILCSAFCKHKHFVIVHLALQLLVTHAFTLFGTWGVSMGAPWARSQRDYLPFLFCPVLRATLGAVHVDKMPRRRCPRYTYLMYMVFPYVT